MLSTATFIEISKLCMAFQVPLSSSVGRGLTYHCCVTGSIPGDVMWNGYSHQVRQSAYSQVFDTNLGFSINTKHTLPPETVRTHLVPVENVRVMLEQRVRAHRNTSWKTKEMSKPNHNYLNNCYRIVPRGHI